MRRFSVGVGRFWGTCLLTALAIVASPVTAAADLVQLKGGEVICLLYTSDAADE